MKLNFSHLDTANSGFQFLEDLSTAYWYSEMLFAAIELNLFELIESGNRNLKALSNASNCKEEELHRLMKGLQGLNLIHETDIGGWINSPVARYYLLPDSDDYMGNFILYRKYIKKGWQEIVERI